MKHIAFFTSSVLILAALFVCSADEKSNSSPITECNDGIDNDGDGRIDWMYDTGCAHQLDNDEKASTRDREDGFTTFEPDKDSILIYVSSSEGKDENDGRSPAKPVKTLTHAASLVRDGHNDFMLLKRGDTWRGAGLGRFKSGRDSDHPLVITSYGESTIRPRIEVQNYFIDHNGREKNFVAILGLQVVPYQKIPGDSAFDGGSGGAFRYVGGGTGLLIEDCHILYGEIILQSYGGYHYRDIEIRRNIIEHNYHVNTCNQNSAYRPSGMYASHATGLTIEGNIFDHNGWNENVPTACATMYNHNMYLNADDLIVRGNIITRASSIGIKMRSDTTGDTNNMLFENNLLADGEIGISIGGNTDESHRFEKVIIRRNVFSQIGIGNPTKRNFAWMLDVQDNKNTVIENNHFLHQPWYNNAYGIQLRGNSNSDISVKSNLFYNLKQRAIYIRDAANGDNIRISGNTIADPGNNSSLIDHNGNFDNVSYRSNHYYSSSGNDWFSVNGSRQTLSEWQKISGETGAVSWTGKFKDPDRTIGSYSASLGLKNSLAAFITEAKKQSRLNRRKEFTAAAVNDYIRNGFK